VGVDGGGVERLECLDRREVGGFLVQRYMGYFGYSHGIFIDLGFCVLEFDQSFCIDIRKSLIEFFMRLSKYFVPRRVFSLVRPAYPASIIPGLPNRALRNDVLQGYLHQRLG
jgi:hypothetical protein